MFKERRIFSSWEPLRQQEQLAAIGAVGLNSLISVIGWSAWKAGYIEIRETSWLKALADCTLMLLAMDIGMYIFHRLAHLPLFFRLHRLPDVTAWVDRILSPKRSVRDTWALGRRTFPLLDGSIPDF